jgi:MoaA/NifB/PqqE/SkfB family radical SAM enzyme
MQLETVGLTGGDPLAHPDIAIILEYLYDLDIVYGVVTAGYMPKDLTKLLAKAKWVRVSLDAVDGKIYSKARGGIATAERVISSLAMMANAGCNLQFGITVNKLNAHHLPQILTKIKVMKEAFGNISEVMVRAVCHHSDAMRATSIPDVDDQVAELKAFDISCDIELTRDPLLPIEHCYATMYQLYPAADGNVYPCCMTAADSEVTPHCRPLFNYENLLSYKEPIHALMAARLAWIQVQPDKLPAICKQDCPTRLNVMNFCAPHLLNLKNFY